MSDVSDTIVAKSDQLNSDDLISGPITVTITAVKRTSEEQPLWLSIGLKQIDGKDKPWKPCKTMRRVLVAAWGKDSDKWVGHSLTLKRDPDVKWAGEAVGGVRVQALSHIATRLELSLTETRGKKKKVIVEKLDSAPATQSAAPAQSDLVGKYAARIATLKTTAEIESARAKCSEAKMDDTARKQIEHLFDERSRAVKPAEMYSKADWLRMIRSCIASIDIELAHTEFEKVRGSYAIADDEEIEAAFAARMEAL